MMKVKAKKDAKARAQARLNRVAVAWAEKFKTGVGWNDAAYRLERAVRAFQKINEVQTKGNK